jgi:hypothetical protein
MDCDNETVIDLIIEANNGFIMDSGPEAGEQLALISFIYKNMKLSIGVEGDIPGVLYEYLYDRIRVRLTKYASIKKITFYVAWLVMNDIEREEIYTWFAADPTLSQ